MDQQNTQGPELQANREAASAGTLRPQTEEAGRLGPDVSPGQAALIVGLFIGLAIVIASAGPDRPATVTAWAVTAMFSAAILLLGLTARDESGFGNTAAVLAGAAGCLTVPLLYFNQAPQHWAVAAMLGVIVFYGVAVRRLQPRWLEGALAAAFGAALLGGLVYAGGSAMLASAGDLYHVGPLHLAFGVFMIGGIALMHGALTLAWSMLRYLRRHIGWGKA